MIRSTAIAIVLATLAALPARAATVEVEQKDKKFSVATITINKGDTVTFHNNDPYTHNVFSATPGMAFELKTQKAGQSSDVKFDNAGEADVQCAIHPQMKMKVVVKP